MCSRGRRLWRHREGEGRLMPSLRLQLVEGDWVQTHGVIGDPSPPCLEIGGELGGFESKCRESFRKREAPCRRTGQWAR